MKLKKQKYQIYALQGVDTKNVFYIGLTKRHIEVRLAAHYAEVERDGYGCFKKKRQAFKKAKYKVEAILIKEIFSTRRKALKEEAAVIRHYLKMGVKLINAAINDNIRDGAGITISKPVAIELKKLAEQQSINPARLATNIIRQYLKSKIAA